MKLEDLKIKIFADGADYKSILKYNENILIKGFTTNPTLMRKAGIGYDYRSFCKILLKDIKNKPISFEVFSDDIEGMFYQAREISSWGDNVYVKIPITNTKGISTDGLIEQLLNLNIKVNVTAVFTYEQIDKIIGILYSNTKGYISIFAGRIADTGVNPCPIIEYAIASVKRYASNFEIIWASPRQVYDVILADQCGCHIITVTNDILNKLSLIGKDITEYSLETVQMFYNDAVKSGFKI